MAHLYKRDQNCYWESEIPDDKIIAVMPNDVSSVRVLYVVKNGVKLEFYPGMPNKRNKDIRPAHDIRRLIVAGFFDEDFGIKK